MTTMKDICVAWVRTNTGPDTPEDKIQGLAQAFFNMSPTGELDHVITAGYILGMIETPDEIKPLLDEMVKQAGVA